MSECGLSLRRASLPFGFVLQSEDDGLRTGIFRGLSAVDCRISTCPAYSVGKLILSPRDALGISRVL
eukprot:2019495-Prymnesium_polylepis.2